jgi:hypothetical protein
LAPHLTNPSIGQSQAYASGDEPAVSGQTPPAFAISVEVAYSSPSDF